MLEFNDEEWDTISHDAKDLIKKILIKDINKRYSAMKNMTSPGDAAVYFMRHFERPAYEENRWYKHGAWVLKLLESK